MKLRYQRVSYSGSVDAGRQLERMLDYLLDASRTSAAVNGRGEWRPPVDMYETDSELAVHVELAGMNEDDIEVILFDDVLVIKGERKPAFGVAGNLTYYEAGVRYGRYRAEVFLPITVEAEQVEARYENGFLRIRLPKPSSIRLRPALVSDSTNG
ncbi:MAG: Hsp20/alpha crystallin family protein [Chloroflexota bacterium]|nr:Hsp20/alpha crystallin family protein [Chloroflexota bacterium]